MLRIVASALIAALLCGCSSKPATMSGTVSFQGKPLAMGHVTVRDSTGQTRACPIKPDGTYSIPDVLSGEVSVAVESQDPSQADIVR